MTAHYPIYWLAMFCIGVAEWLINYDTFFLFVGVPAIAAGATLILGLLLAFSAHGHGELFKQWSHRFGQHETRMNRVGGYRLLSLSTLGLLIILAAAGGSRYAAALHTLAAQPAQNILGDQAVVEVSPLRDVLISLLANLAAWAVGVFIAYFSHDPDPDFMAATLQHKRASRTYYRSRHTVEDQIKTIEAKFGKEMEQMERAANARSTNVSVERELLEQIDKQESGITDAIASVLRANVEHYRDTLAQIVLARRGEVSIVQATDGEKQMTPYEYKALEIRVDPNSVRRFA